MQGMAKMLKMCAALVTVLTLVPRMASALSFEADVTPLAARGGTPCYTESGEALA